nr:hypothetical protein BaRGS_000748 [Batillaria attramentaria]
MAQFKARMLWENIKKGDLTAVHGLLESGNINLEERDEGGRTFLMVASERGELNIVRELLEAGVDPNAVDNEGWSALLCAAKEGHLEITIELLEHGAEKEHKDTCGWTALMWASYKGRIIVVQELLDRGANPNAKADHSMTSLAWAAGRGHTEIVHMLISKGAKVNTADKYGTTPLIWACRKGYVEIVDALLAEGANVDASGMNSWTPLLVATKGGHYDVVHSLLQHDPNVNAVDKDGLTALAIAAKEGYVEIVHDLLAKGAYVNVGDRAGDSILIHAVKGGQIEVVRALVNKYVDVDVQGSEGKTALYWAVEKGYNEIVQLLLASEPDLEICTKDDDTALLRAVRSRNEGCVRMLLEKGAKVSASDKRGDTALHIAIRARSKRITELLLRNPRNSRLLYRPNKAGETPYAMDTYHQRGILQQIHGHRNLNASDAENLLGYDIYSSALADILSGVQLFDQRYNMKVAVGISTVLGKRQRLLMLLLRMLFCNPKRTPTADKKTAINTYSVRFLFSDCTRLTSVGGEKALAAMIATLCHSVENEYGFIVTRLFRVFKPAEGSKRSRFKSLCCIPYFLIVLLVLFCVAAGVALLVQFRIKDHVAVDSVLIAIACILTLTVVGNIYTWAQSIMALVSPQRRRVLKAAEMLDTLKMDGFLQRLKREVELMSRMVTCMDAFTTDQTRLVVIVDGLDSCEQDKVLQVLDTVKSLFCDDNSPFITILAVDPHIIIKGIEQNLRSSFQDTNVNGFDYLRNVVQLPFYLQSQGIRIQHTDSQTDTDRTMTKLGPNVRENNVSGLVLENCDLRELQPILNMRFGDWQLFRAAILSLRDWDPSIMDSDTAGDNVSNSSSTVMSPPQTGLFGRTNPGNVAAESAREGILGPKGRRMRRNDSIVQQLSYEAAIINEAVEEFVEDTDDGEEEEAGGEVEAKNERGISDAAQAESSGPASASEPVGGTQDDAVVAESEPLISREKDEGAGDLSKLITVIEDCPLPGQALLDSPSSPAHYTPFLFQTPAPQGFLECCDQ